MLAHTVLQQVYGKFRTDLVYELPNMYVTYPLYMYYLCDYIASYPVNWLQLYIVATVYVRTYILMSL